MIILGKLAAATLVIAVTTAPMLEPSALRQLSTQQRNAAAQAYAQSATNCVARAVAANARFRRDDPASNLGDLIEASMPKCLGPVRAMMDAYDLYFGDGMGERFFTGPYLDALPSIVVKLITDAAD